MSFRADIDLTMQLAQDYATGPSAGAEHATLKAFFDRVAFLIDAYSLQDIIAAVSDADVDDEIKTFVERTVLGDLARRPHLDMDALKVLFACLDYESLVALSKNATVDELNRSRARVEAERIKQAYLSRF